VVDRVVVAVDTAVTANDWRGGPLTHE